MSYATMMVYVDPDDQGEHVIRLATRLSDKFKSRLIGASAIPIPPPIVANGIVVGPVTDAELDQITSRLSQVENRFRQEAAAPHRAIDWRFALGSPTEFLISQARCADLIIIGAARGFRTPYYSLDPAGAILKAGRPVLVVPPEATSLQAERIVIGWKDAREARRAVQDALPFLHEAERVTIAEICREGDETAAQKRIDDVVNYLTRHRIKGGPKVILHREGSGASQLVRLAQDEGADLIVTGAYGHSRLGEWIFGGVTQDLLASSPICCLMSH